MDSLFVLQALSRRAVRQDNRVGRGVRGQIDRRNLGVSVQRDLELVSAIPTRVFSKLARTITVYSEAQETSAIFVHAESDDA